MFRNAVNLLQRRINENFLRTLLFPGIKAHEISLNQNVSQSVDCCLLYTCTITKSNYIFHDNVKQHFTKW